jgi:hypothetical protein
MSLYYEHLLVPVLPNYRPLADAVTAFACGIIENGCVAANPTITFAKVVTGEPLFRVARNPITGETISIRLPSRTIERPESLSGVSEIIGWAHNESEYDVSVAAEGNPLHPPLTVGFVENEAWKPYEGPYHLEVCCDVRARIVRLYHLESEEDLHRPPDFAKFQPRLDEDCTADEHDGIFVHPEAGAIRIPNAGCGMFWISFEYGKWIFPRLKDNSINVLDQSIIDLARTTFGIDFVEACNWG